MTREHKLALIIGFTLVLVVGVLISDHFSKAHEARLKSEMPETPARNLAADGLRPVGAGSSGGGGGGGSIFGPATASARTTARGPESALPPVTDPTLMISGGEDRTIVMGGRWSTPPEESGQISVPLPGRFEQYTPGPNSTLWNGTTRQIGDPDQQSQTPDAPSSLDGGRDGVRIIRPDGPTIEPPRAEPPRGVQPTPTPAPREDMVNGVPLRMMKRHDVREGESLYGIARQVYGDGTLWNKIAEYNKGKVMANGSVREGVTLLLPPKEALLGRPLPTTNTTPTAPAPARRAEPPSARPADTGSGRAVAGGAPRTYTVQKGDVLSEVARKTLGSSRRWTEILALNSDTLDDGDTLVAGMVLKLPAR